MLYLYIRQTITDYGQWKEAFDRHFSARQAGGATRTIRNAAAATPYILEFGNIPRGTYVVTAIYGDKNTPGPPR